jgi:hypothetical protein
MTTIDSRSKIQSLSGDVNKLLNRGVKVTGVGNWGNGA